MDICFYRENLYFDEQKKTHFVPIILGYSLETSTSSFDICEGRYRLLDCLMNIHAITFESQFSYYDTGYVKGIGVLLVEWQLYFDIGAKEVAWIGMTIGCIYKTAGKRQSQYVTWGWVGGAGNDM